MTILFFISVFLFLILYLIAKINIRASVSDIYKGILPLKGLLELGLFINRAFCFTSQYEITIEFRITELFNESDSKELLRLYMANKIVLCCMVICLGFMIGILLEPVDTLYFFILIAAVIVAFFLPDKELEQKVKKRRIQIQIDFPDFINKLALLVNSGMTVAGAIEKISTDSKCVESNRERILYAELEKTTRRIKLGDSENKAYEDFARRCKLPEVTRFSSIIVQNLRKGNSELVSILRLLSAECWQNRKITARILGEEAETKLIFPMAIMLIAILIIVLAPSVMQLQNI